MEGRSIGNAGGGEARRPGASAEAALVGSGEVLWYVAHTRPRCEKKLATQCGRWGVEVTLPLYASVKKYRGKTVTFQKPLFAGYVFLRFPEALRSRVLQSEHLANLLTVPAQDEFQAQLQAIQKALETSYDVRLCPSIEPGSRVRVRSGPLRGLEGHVELRRGMVEVHLRLDFIGQAAAVMIDADLLELV
jgi:transcription antitermination factor NusG